MVTVRGALLAVSLVAGGPLVSGCASATPEAEEPVVVVSTEAPPSRSAKQSSKPTASAESDLAKAPSQAERAEEVARKAGILGALKQSEGSASAPWGRDDALGSSGGVVQGHMWGDSIGESFGAGGLGLVGAGRGGGGTPGGTIGLGGIGVIGRGGGGSGRGYGSSGYGRLGRSSTSPRVMVGQPSVRGTLSKDVIRRVVRQQHVRIRYCYERSLLKSPKLAGKVITRFVIGRSGAVTSAAIQASTISDVALKQCVVKMISNMQFPQPEGGGIVMVNYPFVFSPAPPPAPAPAPAKPGAPPAAPAAPPAAPAAPQQAPPAPPP